MRGYPVNLRKGGKGVGEAALSGRGVSGEWLPIEKASQATESPSNDNKWR